MSENEIINPETTEPTKARRKTTPTAIYPETPTRIVAIDSQYIRDYFKGEYEAGRIKAPIIKKYSKRYKELVAEKGERAYFQTYRTEFVKEFFPALAASQKKQNKESMSDFLDSLLK